MRARRLAVSAVVALAACSKPPEKVVRAGPPSPPPEQLDAVLIELNELCADTWCEGGYEFSFKKLECASAAACTLSFDATHDESGRSVPAAIVLGGFETVVDSEGYATETFENAVNDAIAEWETKQGS